MSEKIKCIQSSIKLKYDNVYLPWCLQSAVGENPSVGVSYQSVDQFRHKQKNQPIKVVRYKIKERSIQEI